jgi:hypothetical protein
MAKTTFLFLFTICSAITQAQSGWVLDKQYWYWNTTASYCWSSTYYTLDNEPLLGSTYHSGALHTYGEYGITNRVTLTTGIPLLKIQGFSTTNAVYGLGDLAPGVKVGILKHKFPLAAFAIAEIPTGSSEDFATNKQNGIEMINLPSGDGEWNLKTGLALSHSFYPKPFYTSAFAQYNFRTQYEETEFHDQFNAGLEAGYLIRNTYYLIAKANIQKIVGNEMINAIDFVRGEGTEFTNLQLVFDSPLYNNLHIHMRYDTYLNFPVTLKNSYRLHCFGIGISMKK